LGTGSGYALAIIAKTVGAQGRVYSVERNQQIASFARTRLEEYGITNTEIVFKDGSEGLISKAPYEAVHISFAYEDIPEQLVSQLKVGARLVTPITNTEIKLVIRISEDQYEQESITAKQFKKVVRGVQ
jgi:protein-L-isoaspartate(D-aspartate) O-methyltransferase